MEDAKQFQVSADEVDYLRQLTLIDDSLRKELQSIETVPGRSVTIRLSRRSADGLRDCLTTQLANVGFDIDYSPNEQGLFLEELIDRFYMP